MAEDVVDALTHLMRMAKPGRTLVVGNRVYETSTDRRRLYRDGFGVDMLAGEGVDLVHDLEQPLPDGFRFDHIDLVSVMEHCKRPWKMAANLEKALVPGGTILLSVPFVWRVHAYPSDYWRITPATLDILFPRCEWLERGFMIDGRTTKLVRGLTLDTGTYMQRAETVGLGRKCLTS